MNFHQNTDFKEAILAAAHFFNMRPEFIEKDYWVTKSLKNLFLSNRADSTVFKGGTSLSKVFECIQRFSEDIDLAIMTTEGASQMAIKRQLKAVEVAASIGLQLLDNPPPIKRGKNRFSCYAYPSVFLLEQTISLAPYLRLEISAFTNPVPCSEKSIQSYLGQFLNQQNETKLMEDYGLMPFNLLVLDIKRTFCEKLLALIRISYKGEDELRAKLRHFYDLTLLLKKEQIQDMIDDENLAILRLAYQDDISHTTFRGEWMDKPFIEAPLFAEFDKLWNNLKSHYVRELTELSWNSEIPSEKEIKVTFSILKAFVQNFTM